MTPIKRALAENAIHIYLRPNLIGLAPPLTITEEQLLDGVARIDRVLSVADDMLAKPAVELARAQA